MNENLKEELEEWIKSIQDKSLREIAKRLIEATSYDELAKVEQELHEMEIELFGREKGKDGLQNDIYGLEYDTEITGATYEDSEVKNEEEIEEDFDWEAAFDIEDDEIEENPQQQQIEEMSERKEQQKNKKLIELLREQAEVQSQITKVSWVKSAREGKEKVNQSVKKLSDYLDRQAEIYGANKESIAQIVKDYKEKLDNDINEKNETISRLEKEKCDFEEKEIQEISEINKIKNSKKKYEKSPEYKEFKKNCREIEKSIIEETKNGELDVAESLIKCLKNKIDKSELSKYDKELKEHNAKLEEARKQIQNKKDEIKDERKKLEELNPDKNKVDEKIKEDNGIIKQNTFQKFIGSIAFSFKKIGGKKKFEEKITKPIKEAISTMGDGIKSVPVKISDVCDTIKNKKDITINKVKESIIESIEKKNEKLAELQNANER